MRAPIGDRVNGHAPLQQQHLRPTDRDRRRHVVLQLLGRDRRLPIGRRLLEGVLVDSDALAERQVTTTSVSTGCSGCPSQVPQSRSFISLRWGMERSTRDLSASPALSSCWIPSVRSASSRSMGLTVHLQSS